MSLGIYFQFVSALAIVVALIAGLAWLVRRFGWAGRFMAPVGKRRLAVLEVLPLDGKRRLVLLRRDAAEHLVLLGTEHDLLVERDIEADGAAPASFGTFAERAAP